MTMRVITIPARTTITATRVPLTIQAERELSMLWNQEMLTHAHTYTDICTQLIMVHIESYHNGKQTAH
jgi:hypothetical protein